MEVMKKAFEIADLIANFIKGEISREGLTVLDQWLEESEDNRLLFVSFMDDAIFQGEKQKYTQAYMDALFEKISLRKRQLRKQRVVRRIQWLTGVAAVVCVVFAVVWFVREQPGPDVHLAETSGISVGKQKACLILASGERYELTGHRSDTVTAKENDRQIIFNPGEVKVSGEGAVAGETIKYNVMEVPRGAEYSLVLPDGTRVWLNADTKLRFPLAFEEHRRYVELTGEAYFQVTPDAERPFVVHSQEVDVTVLGTEFCVSNYTGKPTFTTLVKGKVKVVDKEGWKAILKPGEQAVTQYGKSEVREVETLYYTAWKDGFFIFENTTLEEIMEKLSLWYNCQFFFENQEAAKIRMTARLKKYDEIDVLLNILSKTKEVGFEKKENTILIRRK